MRVIFCFLMLMLFLQPDVKAQLQTVDAISQKQPDSSLTVLRKLQATAAAKNDEVTVGLSLQKMGQICFNQGHYAQALDFYLHADKIFNSISNKNLNAANLADMGLLYYYNKQLNKAQQTYNKALGLYQQTGNKAGQADILGKIGHLYEKRHQYGIAFRYQNLALAKYTTVNNKLGKAKIYENLGSIYEDLAKYDSAYICFNRSLKFYRAEQNNIAVIEVINNLGDILRKTGRYAASIVESRKALALATQSGNIYQQASCAKDIGQAYALMNRMDSAYQYSELSRRYASEVYSKDAANQTVFLQVLYDMSKKSDEINRLNNIRNINRVITIAVVIVAALIIILGVVVFSRQRLKLRDQQAQHELKKLEENSLKQQLEQKSKELSTHTLNLIKNNQLLENLRNTLQVMVKEDKRDQKKQMQQIILQINESFSHEQHWKEFTNAFEQVHQSFFEKLRAYSNELTSADMRLIALLKINLDSNDIATLLGISPDSLRVSRYRLRKKLNIPQGDNLTAFIQNL